MSEAIVWFDPGQSTGWSLWALSDDRPIMRLDYGLVHGGLNGVQEFMDEKLSQWRLSAVGVEHFNEDDGRLRNGGSPYPMLVEGAIRDRARAIGVEVILQPTSAKDQARRSLLREHGLYITRAEARTNPQIMWKDGDDVNDTQSHALAMAKMSDHLPTIELYWPDV